MVQLNDLKTHALQISKNKLGDEVKDVVVGEEENYEGDPSFRVTIILKSKWSVDPPGNSLNEISRQLRSYLSSNGDSRFAYTHYMTSREYSDLNDRPKSTSGRGRRAS
jgi:hypothetical protein